MWRCGVCALFCVLSHRDQTSSEQWLILSLGLRCKVGEKGEKEWEQSDNLQTLIHIPNLPYSLNKNQWILNSESWMPHEKDSLSHMGGGGGKKKAERRWVSLTALRPVLRENSIWGYERPHPTEVHHLSALPVTLAYMDHFSKWTRRVPSNDTSVSPKQDAHPQLWSDLDQKSISCGRCSWWAEIINQSQIENWIKVSGTTDERGAKTNKLTTTAR